MATAGEILSIWSHRLIMNRDGATRWTPSLRRAVESLVENLKALDPAESVEVDVHPNRSPIARFINSKTGEILGEIDMHPQSEVDLIKALLLHEWDPIGVSGCEGAEDEYDTYALQVVEMHKKGADADAIAHYLNFVITSKMGLRGNPEKDRAIAAKAIAIRESKADD